MHEIIHKVEQFCKALRLRLFVPKSWTWALPHDVAKQLQTLALQGEHIPSHCQVKDLGVDITYRGQKPQKTLLHRISLGLKRCSKLHNSDAQSDANSDWGKVVVSLKQYMELR